MWLPRSEAELVHLARVICECASASRTGRTRSQRGRLRFTNPRRGAARAIVASLGIYRPILLALAFGEQHLDDGLEESERVAGVRWEEGYRFGVLLAEGVEG
jgi:hypothetical protein